MAVVMGTAGHIDHGKTSLVRALTGIDCDRLDEERRRGITIELGFAFLDLVSGERMGIVDMPGHERFVKNMAAGAACIDFVLLVVAADEGVMPQTREHLDICTLLGIDNGIVALTKADAVDEELLELAREDVAEFLEGTFLESAPMIPVSSMDGPSGRGLDELREAIGAVVSRLTERPRSDLFRLPVDRVFSLRGHGTVITGTMISGQVEVGAEVEAFPTGTRARVRSLQSHGEGVDIALPGRRTAVNLQGAKVEDVNRGDVIGRSGELFGSLAWDVELSVLESSPRALKHRTEVHFHHGSREVLARLYFKGVDRVRPGESALCQVRFSEPMVGIYGDRCVVRSFSPLQTVAGGRLVNPLGRRIRPRSAQAALVADLVGGQPGAGREATPEVLVDRQLALAGPQGLTLAQLRTMTPLTAEGLVELMDELAGREEAVLYDRAERREDRGYAHGALVTELAERAEKFLADYHKREPLNPGLSRAALASAWDKDLSPRLVSFLIEHMAASGRAVAQQDIIRLPSHNVTLTEAQEQVRAKLRAAYAGYGLTPPNLEQVLEDHSIGDRQAPPILRMLCQAEELVRVTDAQYYSAAAMNGLKDSLRGFFETHQDMGLPEFKELTGLSRKYIIPLLEFLDKERFLLRVGDKRQLRGK